MFMFYWYNIRRVKMSNLPSCQCGHIRLQQPVQNPISDNTNVLWNSPSLGKNYNNRVPLVL